MDALDKLQALIRGLNRAIVAFSGGVDSALLAYLARQQLGKENMIAITGDSASVPSRDRDFIQSFGQQYDIPHQFIQTFEYENPNYRNNPDNRCFYCKEELYHCLKEYAVQHNYPHILDGTNTTDLKGHRPGFEALRKAEIKALYVDLGIDKSTIRAMANHFNLTVAIKPQSACLASRVPTGTPIDLEALRKIDQAENILKDLGIQNPRVRFHGTLARLQLKKEEWDFCLKQHQTIELALQTLGFQFVALDLKEYDREG